MDIKQPLGFANCPFGNPIKIKIQQDQKLRNTNNIGTDQYRLEATVQLEHLVETAIKEETLKLVKQPALALYYYKDEANQDKVVKVQSIKTMMDKNFYPEKQKRDFTHTQCWRPCVGLPYFVERTLKLWKPLR